jgi:hypothetical protein
MADIWGDDFDNEEESDFLNVESKNDFVKSNLSVILEEIDKIINDFAKENCATFQSYIIYNDDKSCTFKNDAYVLFEVYCAVVDRIFDEYIKQRDETKSQFINNLREVIDNNNHDKYYVDAILQVDSFEKFANFMIESNQITETAREDILGMGL